MNYAYIHTYIHTLYGRGKPAQKFGERFPCRAGGGTGSGPAPGRFKVAPNDCSSGRVNF